MEKIMKKKKKGRSCEVVVGGSEVKLLGDRRRSWRQERTLQQTLREYGHRDASPSWSRGEEQADADQSKHSVVGWTFPPNPLLLTMGTSLLHSLHVLGRSV